MKKLFAISSILLSIVSIQDVFASEEASAAVKETTSSGKLCAEHARDAKHVSYSVTKQQLDHGPHALTTPWIKKQRSQEAAKNADETNKC